ncbi:Ribonuclease H2 subunit A [Thelohanellus kitauei]|uniref:Ribonuclease n=1 Tax=Thelohanellus kitauei TaxID=669202 RepID=A0A0C2N1X2_THEKT|nr:Ribonuclease H2 subunit A [Thelohanellus kitauei]
MPEKVIDLRSWEDLENNTQRIYENNLQNTFFNKPIEDLVPEDALSVGIDEAGRGCILGHMLVCAFHIRISSLESLETIGCTDSKKLSPQARVEIFKRILSDPAMGFCAKAISPSFISHNALKPKKYDLNAITRDAAVQAMSKIKSGSIKEIYADTVGTPSNHTQYLKTHFPTSDVTVSTKADLKFKVVGAASICAKVIRDFLLDNWIFTENVTNRNFGSGYTSDTITIQWLNDVFDPTFGFPNLVRFSWSTCAAIMLKKFTKAFAKDQKPPSGRKVET